MHLFWDSVIQINGRESEKLTLCSRISTDFRTFYDQNTILGSYGSIEKIAKAFNVVSKDKALEKYTVFPLSSLCHCVGLGCCWGRVF